MLVSSGFVHLHVHSNYSLLEGASTIAELLARAKALGMSALALTDTNGLYGIPFFYKLARELGIRPIPGCEIVTEKTRTVLLARNRNGYTNLCKIVTARQLDETFFIERALERYGADLYVLCPDISAFFSLQSIVEPGRLYLESSTGVPPVARTEPRASASGPTTKRPAVSCSVSVPRHDTLYVPPASHFRCRLEVPPKRDPAFGGTCATCAAFDVRYATPSRRTLLQVLLAIKNNLLLEEQAKEMPQGMTYLKSPEEVQAIFGRTIEPIENAARIAADCNVELPGDTLIFPKLELSKEGSETIPPYLEKGARGLSSFAPVENNPLSPPLVRGKFAIRLGLSEVKGLSLRTISAIIKEQQRGPQFSSLDDFLARVRCATQAEVESLILCGAMESLDCTRSQLMWQWRLLQSKFGVRSSEFGEGCFARLSHCPELLTPNSELKPLLPDYPRGMKIKLELAALGISVTGHPLERDSQRRPGFRPEAPQKRATYVPLSELGRHVGEVVSIRGWLVTRRRIITKNGRLMMFVTLEDADAVVEITFFPTAYRQFGNIMERSGVYLVKGKVDEHGNIEGRWLASM